MSRRRRVLVLGCGPAGLMAVHAAAKADCDVIVVSKAQKSPMLGAQYLHSPIPDATPADSEFQVQYNLWGTTEEYRRKVYGSKWDGSVSPEDLSETHQAWDIRTTYDWLWACYASYIKDWDASPAALTAVLANLEPDLCVSTIPAPLLCGEGHQFAYTTIWATNKAFAQGMPDNTVVCNGQDVPSWYRASRIQGHENTEWAASAVVKPPFKGVAEVTKPLKTQCICFPDVVRAGRYGEWTKGVLSDSAYWKVESCLRTLSVPS